LAGAAPPCARGEDGWISFSGPDFKIGRPFITALTVIARPGERGIPVVTNGDQVLAGDLGACTWTELYRLAPSAAPLVPLSAETATITHLAWGDGTVYLAVEEDLGPAARVHVVTLREQGATWASVHRGLPAAATSISALEVSPADPRLVYLLVGEGTGSALYASADAGASWERRSALPSGFVASGLALDPLVPEELWAYGSGLKRSLDGGRSWQTIDSLGGTISLADVFHAPSEPARVLAYEPDGMTWWRSDDAGRTWRVFGSPSGDLQSVASGASADSVLISLHQGVYRLRPPSYWVEETPADHDGLFELTADGQARPWIFGRAGERVLVYTALDARATPATFTVVPAEVQRSPARLVPAVQRVVVPPGRTRSARVRLKLPPSPTPLDVFFLVDTTESMQSSIDSLRAGLQSIVDALAGLGIDARFGVAEYRDYPTAVYGSALAGDRPYVLGRRVGPPDAGLAGALARLSAGGGGDFPEAQLTALYQAVSGAGDPVGLVPPGGQAGFRPDALRVIVNVTDAPFHEGPQHPSPEPDEVARALVARGVLQVGLAVYGPQGLEPARSDLARMAELTGALAPGPVDCDGDGATDLDRGEPLVCPVVDALNAGRAGLPPAIVALLQAVRDEAPIGLAARRGRPLVRAIRPALLEAVNLKEPQHLSFEVTFGCPGRLAGAERAVELFAHVRGRAVARAGIVVECLAPSAALAGPEPSVPAALPVARAAGATAPPPPQPPEQIPQQQPHAHTQGALAKQEQEQPQLAYVAALREAPGEQAYAFSRPRRADGAPPLAVAAGALLATALGLARRSEPARAQRR
jgi:hypothetical protein